MQEQVLNRDEVDCMSFEGFIRCIIIDIQKELGSGYTFDVENIIKNNDTMFKGLVIKKQDCSVHPTIYMEGFYEQYRAGGSLEAVKDRILQICRESTNWKEFDVAFFADWQKVKEKVTYKLVNFDRNRELLKAVPHRRFLDLAIVYECIVATGGGTASILIRSGHAKSWGITEDELYDTALDNTPKLRGFRFFSMAEVIKELTGCTINDSYPMYVLTNRHKFHGAGCILYKGLLKEIAQNWGCDICIIPSSIHEILLIPMNLDENYGEMSKMVRQVNQTQVVPEEILSDHVYQFVRETGKIIMKEEKGYE